MNPRTQSVLLISILSIILIVILISYYYVRPFPPTTLVMATGMERGSYFVFGEHYRQILARDGIQVKLRPSSGSVENFNLLKDRSQEVDAGFVQGTMGKIDETSGLVSLGSLAYTPLWVFYTGTEILDDLSQLKGKRIVIGPQGSGIQQFASELLKFADVSAPPAVLYEFQYSAATQALKKGRVDVVMVFGPTDHPVVVELLHTKGVKLMNLSQAEAYTRFFPDLYHVVLPKGVINPANRYPPFDVHLISPTTNLIVRKNLHPALIYLLLKASVEIHGGAGWVNRAGEFPSIRKQDDPISDQAQRFHKSGGSVLYEYLPFWMGTFVDRMILILVPLGVVLIPLIGVLPWIYTWRNRSKYYRVYHELRNIEKEITRHMQPEDVKRIQEKLDGIDEALSGIRVSVAFLDEVFTLKEHIHIVKKKLNRLNQSGEAPEDVQDR